MKIKLSQYQQFKAWAMDFYELSDRQFENCKEECDMIARWHAWKGSRSSMVIKITNPARPKASDYVFGVESDHYQSDMEQYKEDKKFMSHIRQVLEDEGVTVK